MVFDSVMHMDERDQLVARTSEIAALAGALAHEIRNPLSTINLNLELLIEDIEDSESARDRRMQRKIQTVQRECRHLEAILDDFLKFARAGALDLATADLNEVVQEFIDFYQPEAAAQAVEISPHLSGGLPPVRLDRAMFRQMLMNLALNAQQAMPKGGLLELQTYVRDDLVHLDLIDTGSGIDPATRAKMFDIFYSTKPGGSGLGLPTVRRIVEAHGGRISVESEPGRGTRFTISLTPLT